MRGPVRRPKRPCRLDPKLSDAHLAMGRILGELEWDWPAADAEFKRTLELDPNNVLALWCASGYALIGDRLDEALQSGNPERRRSRRDPFMAIVHRNRRCANSKGPAC